ncbi:hypothetical protein GCM10010191_61060 [Actinomadura vinacea]|uniref:VOC domain-containing protein n=1 Tax=Actinomadura vinacea TaxID=115336 RepID=A0ABN3JU51_9ACTN
MVGCGWWSTYAHLPALSEHPGAEVVALADPDPALSGGGQGQTQITHAAALLLWLTGLRPRGIAAFRADSELEVDLADSIAIRFEGGAIGTMSSTGAVLPDHEEIMRLEIFGRHGHILLDVNQGTAKVHHADGLTELPRLPPRQAQFRARARPQPRGRRAGPGPQRLPRRHRPGGRPVRRGHVPLGPGEHGHRPDTALRGTEMLTGFSHVGFTVTDVEEAAAFYRKVFEAEPLVRRVYDAPYTSVQVGYPDTRLDIAIFQIPGSDGLLELIQYLNPVGVPVDLETRNPGTAHLCLNTDDLDAEHTRLTGLGATPRSAAPVEITSGPNAGRRVAYFRDPQGLTLELMEIR